MPRCRYCGSSVPEHTVDLLALESANDLLKRWGKLLDKAEEIISVVSSGGDLRNMLKEYSELRQEL